MDSTLRIAIQTKGRLNEDSVGLIKETGIDLISGKRRLISAAKNFPMEVLYLRDDDIPQSVADGVADIGIVGLNEVAEKKQQVDIIKHLGFSKCRLSLAIPQSQVNEYEGPEWFNGKKIATSYPEILKDFLAEKKIDTEIHVITGSVEIAPGIGLADAIFDIVSSGSTLVSNRLKEVEAVMKSEAVLVANPQLSKEKQGILDELIFRIESVEMGKGKKYILLNAPNHKIDKIVEVLPGTTSPTVMPLAIEGWSSLHSVIDDNEFWEVIGNLKKNGAEGILVVPIEKMIL
ncbi:ATP phosphoribosyltransferase [Prolixibacter denitrificans]|uniref:ATP phosphoribosyltransferase n=1 Tax=Prolixibacter denitrificans TaxID=1541063 RepID=A0A2P8CJR1_9BACT|nr:ATP phosphoribosyltransferase [Prolixibacter denitrificans]PSK85218.1 ATP phosphoribosyltransferase [Prolixibacter denitrificans]GET19840.1 ATP phosphoribosyltransferase [Prolixibacter denitrificans]